MTCLNFTFACLLIVTVYWGVSAAGNKRDVYRQALLPRFLTGIAPVVSYALIYVPVPVGWLGQRFLPDSVLLRLAGSCLCVCGLGFACWARRTLGRNWSNSVTVKEDHQLVQTGPYGLVRHPIYAGLLLFVIGAAVVLGEVRGLAALAIAAGGLAPKMADEERVMRRQFPDAYPEYQKRVRKLIPFIY